MSEEQGVHIIELLEGISQQLSVIGEALIMLIEDKGIEDEEAVARSPFLDAEQHKHEFDPMRDDPTMCVVCADNRDLRVHYNDDGTKYRD